VRHPAGCRPPTKNLCAPGAAKNQIACECDRALACVVDRSGGSGSAWL
jgi:hypothetical protein